MRTVLLATIAATLTGFAAAATEPRTLTAPATVTALAADSRRVAYAAARSTSDCDRVRIWSLQTRRITTLGRRTSCEQTSTGSGIAALALLEDRALWLHYTGGNIREWSLWTATATNRRPRRLQTVARDVDDPPPIVVGNGDGSRFADLLPYAVGQQVIVLRADGARRFSWPAPARVVALGSAYGETAVAMDDGQVTVLDAAGRVVGTESFAPGIEIVRITGNRVVVQRGRTLEQRGAGSSTSFLLPRGARLEDAFGDRALFVAGNRIRELKLTTGAERTLAPGLHVQVSLATLYVSSGRRITARVLR